MEQGAVGPAKSVTRPAFAAVSRNDRTSALVATPPGPAGATMPATAADRMSFGHAFWSIAGLPNRSAATTRPSATAT